MENTQLSLLNALFSGKGPGDAASVGKALSSNGKPQEDPQGFLSFLQGLLSQSSAESENFLNKAEALKGKLPFQRVDLEASLEKPVEESTTLDGVSLFGAPVATAPLADPAAAASLQQDSEIAVQGELEVVGVKKTSAAGQQQAVAANSLNDVLVANVTNAKQQPFEGALGQTGTAQEILEQVAPPAEAASGVGVASETPAAKVLEVLKAGDAPVQQTALSPTETEAGDIVLSDEISKDAKAEIGRDRDDLGPQTRPAGIVDNVKSNASIAIAEQAAPQALAQSAVGREIDDGAIEFERDASVKLETAARAVERNGNINSVRDQITAAVAVRPGESKLEVRLDPPELGRVTLGFERDGAHLVRAVVTADTPDTLDLMRRNADILQRALEDQGLSNLDLQFADTSGRENAPESSNDNARVFSLATEDETMAVSAPTQGNGLVNGRLDRRL